MKYLAKNKFIQYFEDLSKPSKRGDMSVCEDFIKKMEKSLPEQCTVQDLVDAGIFRSPQAASSCRTKKNCPDYFKIPGRGIIYPRDAVIKFLQKHARPIA